MISETQFNRSTLECMTHLRRLLKQRTGVVVHLGEPLAVQQLLELSNGSEAPDIRDLGQQLARLLRPARSQPETPPPPAASNSAPVRIYRGQVVRG